MSKWGWLVKEHYDQHRLAGEGVPEDCPTWFTHQHTRQPLLMTTMNLPQSGPGGIKDNPFTKEAAGSQVESALFEILTLKCPLYICTVCPYSSLTCSLVTMPSMRQTSIEGLVKLGLN